MTARIIELNSLSQARREIASLACDKVGIELMAPKSLWRVLKLKGLRPAAANIIKQEMLSLGGDAATAYGAINHSVKQTDVLIFGSLKQLFRLIKKLKRHQFGLPQISLQLEESLKNYESTPSPLKIGNRIFNFGRRTYIMGILNVTPDSFSDGGTYLDPERALARAKLMFKEGADIIDVGGESTRPGAETISPREELKRVIPVIKALSKNRRLLISIDTRKAKVAEAALAAGAHMVNDVSGLRFDRKMAGVVAKHKIPVCSMHTRGTPRDMQKNPLYSELMEELIEYLEESLAIAKNAGILLKKIILDPGLGFGKTPENNLEILKKLKELKVLGCPILVGPSRKSLIGKVLGLPVTRRLEGTAAAVAVAIANGANLVRVHDVKEMSRVVRMTDAIVRRF
jgi:dihydropteroate synthase